MFAPAATTSLMAAPIMESVRSKSEVSANLSDGASGSKSCVSKSALSSSSLSITLRCERCTLNAAGVKSCALVSSDVSLRFDICRLCFSWERGETSGNSTISLCSESTTSLVWKITKLFLCTLQSLKQVCCQQFVVGINVQKIWTFRTPNSTEGLSEASYRRGSIPTQRKGARR